MSKEVFHIDLEKAVTGSSRDLMRDSYVVEQSQYKPLKTLYDMGESEFLQETKKERLFAELIISLASTDSVDYDDEKAKIDYQDEIYKYKPEYANIPLSVEARRYLEAIAAIKDGSRKIGKIAARAALSIADGKTYSDIKAETDVLYEAFMHEAHEQIRLDQARTDLHINIGDEKHIIKAGPGRSLDELRHEIEEIAPMLTREQIDYVMQTYDQGGTLGGGVVTLTDLASGSGCFLISVKQNIAIDIKGDKIYASVDLSYQLREAQDEDAIGTIIGTLSSNIRSDMSELKSTHPLVPGLASQEIIPSFEVISVMKQSLLGLPADSILDRGATLRYYSRIVAESALPPLDTRHGLEEAAKFVSAYQPLAAVDLILEIQKQHSCTPAIVVNLIGAIAAEHKMDQEAWNKLFVDVLAKQSANGFIAQMISAETILRSNSTGSVSFDEIAGMIHEIHKAKTPTMDFYHVGALCQTISRDLGMSKSDELELFTRILVKNAKDSGANMDSVVNTLVSVFPEGIDKKEAVKLIEAKAKNYDVPHLISTRSKIASRFSFRRDSSPSFDEKRWSPSAEFAEGMSSPMSRAASPSAVSRLDSTKLMSSPPPLSSPDQASPASSVEGRVSQPRPEGYWTQKILAQRQPVTPTVTKEGPK